MNSFLDRFALWRRQARRLAVRWLAAVQVREVDGFLGLPTEDISLRRVCLQAITPDALRQVRSCRRHMRLRVRLPAPYGILEAEAQLQWARQEGGRQLSGWAFTRMGRPCACSPPCSYSSSDRPVSSDAWPVGMGSASV